MKTHKKEGECDCSKCTEKNLTKKKKVGKKPRKKTITVRKDTDESSVPHHIITTVQMSSPANPAPYQLPRPFTPGTTGLDQFQLSQLSMGRTLGQTPASRNMPSQTPTAPTMNRFNQPVTYDVEQNLPEQPIYRSPPLLPELIPEAVVINNNSGMSSPMSSFQGDRIPLTIPSATPLYDTMAYEDPYRTMEEIKSRNELIRDSIDTQSAIENSIRDEYNLFLNSTPGNRPGEEELEPGEEELEPGEEELDQGPSPYIQTNDGSGGQRGRPFSQLTDLDISRLEAYQRVMESTKRKNRSIEEQTVIAEGQRIISNKRSNPNLKPILDGIKAKLQEEKKPN